MASFRMNGVYVPLPSSSTEADSGLPCPLALNSGSVTIEWGMCFVLSPNPPKGSSRADGTGDERREQAEVRV